MYDLKCEANAPEVLTQKEANLPAMINELAVILNKTQDVLNSVVYCLSGKDAKVPCQEEPKNFSDAVFKLMNIALDVNSAANAIAMFFL